MLLFLAASALVIGAFALILGNRRKRTGPEMNWHNEDYLSRERDGTWAEGSTMESNSSAPPYRPGGAGNVP
jgi:hypothetical protein